MVVPLVIADDKMIVAEIMEKFFDVNMAMDIDYYKTTIPVYYIEQILNTIPDKESAKLSISCLIYNCKQSFPNDNDMLNEFIHKSKFQYDCIVEDCYIPAPLTLRMMRAKNVVNLTNRLLQIPLLHSRTPDGDVVNKEAFFVFMMCVLILIERIMQKYGLGKYYTRTI